MKSARDTPSASCIGRALLLEPDLLVLDEPSTGLAPKAVREIVEVVRALRRKGMSFLLVEQQVGVASECSDRAYVMSLGLITQSLFAGDWHAPRDRGTNSHTPISAEAAGERSGTPSSEVSLPFAWHAQTVQ